MSESLRNDGRIWVPANSGRRPPRPARFPRPTATTTSSADLPRVRQPGPARHRFPRRQERLRRGPRGRPRRPRRLPRLRRRDRRAWVARRSRTGTATCSRCTADHRRRPVPQTPMRIYPAVHYTMGGLWVDYDLQSTIAGPVRDRRGQLLRPRRQPARRQRLDAGPGRRLLRAARHPQRLPGRRRRSSRSTPRTRRRARPPTRPRAHRGPAVHRRRPHGRLLPQGTRHHHVGLLRHGAHRGGPDATPSSRIRELKAEFWSNVAVTGDERRS